MTPEQSCGHNEQRRSQAKLVHIEWTDINDLIVFFRALQIAETDLGIDIPYGVHLTQGPVRYVIDATGKVGSIKSGALVTFNTKNPLVVITQVELDEPSRYTIADGFGNPRFQITTTREDKIVIRVAEEVYHLNDHSNGRLPPHRVDKGNIHEKYEQPGYEQDAMFYGFRLLAQVFPDKWKIFYEMVTSKPRTIKIQN